jgi:type IV pilus assembly protein PilC
MPARSASSALTRLRVPVQAAISRSARPSGDVQVQRESILQTVRTWRRNENAWDYIIGVSLRQRAQFYRQLYSTLHAGVPVGLALTTIAQNSAISLRSRIRKLAEHVEKGKLLSEGMAGYPNLFPEWEVSVVYAAEKSGTLPNAMHDIADALEMEWDLRARTRASTFHLKATAFVLILVLLILAAVHSGTSDQVFAQVGQAAIRFVFVLIGIGLLIYGWRIIGRFRPMAAAVAAMVPRTPMIGPIWRDMARIRFLRVLATLWAAGVSPIESLEVAARTTGNQHLMNQVRDLSKGLSQGTSSLSSIIAATRFLSPEAVSMLQVGETTGGVAEALEKTAEYYYFELSAQVKTLPHKIQLLMYAVLVPVVFYVMYKFYVAPSIDAIKMLGQ